MRIKLPKIDRRLLIFMAIIGPGIITATAGNDAGGIATYSVVGAHYGFKLLWVLFLITFSLAMVQEMSARMGAATGKGLSDLIREEFGLGWTIFAMLTLFIANVATTIAEFAGVAASLEILGVTKYISVPLVALIIWYFIIRGNFKIVERIFLGFCVVFITYVIAGFMVNPDWGLVFKEMFTPSFQLDSSYILVFIATIGTTVTPWMQFFIQSTVVDKGISIRRYKYERLDVLFGALFTDFIAFFIIVCAAATLFKQGIRIETASDAAIALEPIAGSYAKYLFALGLFGASTLAASILPLSSSYAICEAFGWEAGLSRRWKEAPVFYWLYTFLIGVGAVVILFPKIPLVFVMLLSQHINGILLPIILIFMLLLVNNKRLMGKYVNSLIYNIVVWLTVGAVILLTLIWLGISIFPR